MSRKTLLCLNTYQALPDIDRPEDVMKPKREGRYHEASVDITNFKLNLSLRLFQETGHTEQRPQHPSS